MVFVYILSFMGRIWRGATVPMMPSMAARQIRAGRVGVAARNDDWLELQ